MERMPRDNYEASLLHHKEYLKRDLRQIIDMFIMLQDEFNCREDNEPDICEMVNLITPAFESYKESLNTYLNASHHYKIAKYN